ncbi:unnamed protein product [Rhizophagus irregularis]|nr:unnamed protein product [Rhizophagus irregularis]
MIYQKLKLQNYYVILLDVRTEYTMSTYFNFIWEFLLRDEATNNYMNLKVMLRWNLINNELELGDELLSKTPMRNLRYGII